MTREQMELRFRRAGLTSPQVTEAMEAAEAYATAQAKAAIDALGYVAPPSSVLHWQVYRPVSGPACDPLSGEPCTTIRADVTCGKCWHTHAWKKAAA